MQKYKSVVSKHGVQNDHGSVEGGAAVPVIAVLMATHVRGLTAEFSCAISYGTISESL